MLSYHNDPATKAKFQQRFAAHRAADEVIQGQGFQNGRGCFVGCTLDNYDHAQFPVELGWPEWLARLADTIFEGIPESAAPQFGTNLLAAVPAGADLEPVRYITSIARHTRQIARLDGNDAPYAEQCREALQGVISYCQKMLVGDLKDGSADATAAAADATAAAADATAAAWSAESAAWSSARSAEYEIERDELLSAVKSLALTKE